MGFFLRTESPNTSDLKSVELFKYMQQQLESYSLKLEEEKNKRIEFAFAFPFFLPW